METIIGNTVAAALDTLELHYTRDGENFTCTLCEEDANFRICIIADEKNELLLVIGYFPVKISKMNRDKMYKVINDLNDQHMVGGFVIDSNDGELIYRLANNVDGGAINERVVLACFFQVFNRLKGTYDDIMKSMYGGEHYTFTFGNENRPCA